MQPIKYTGVVDSCLLPDYRRWCTNRDPQKIYTESRSTKTIMRGDVEMNAIHLHPNAARSGWRIPLTLMSG